jgi:hypothetical protein
VRRRGASTPVCSARETQGLLLALGRKRGWALVVAVGVFVRTYTPIEPGGVHGCLHALACIRGIAQLQGKLLGLWGLLLLYVLHVSRLIGT